MKKSEPLISAQILLDVVHHCLARAENSYTHGHGPGVTVVENHQAAAALILTVVSLESYLNRLLYLSRSKRRRREFQKLVEKPLRDKLVHFVDDQHPLLDHLQEVLVCRDFVVHAYMWVGRTDY